MRRVALLITAILLALAVASIAAAESGTILPPGPTSNQPVRG